MSEMDFEGFMNESSGVAVATSRIGKRTVRWCSGCTRSRTSTPAGVTGSIVSAKTTTEVRSVSSFASTAPRLRMSWSVSAIATAMAPATPPLWFCPHCLCIEWVREQIEAGELSWTQPIFKIDLDDGNEMIIHAGGFTGLFSKRDMDDAEKRQLKKAKIRLDEAFKESSMASKDYILSVVSNDAPDECVIATEKKSVGDKLKKAIRDACEEAVDEGRDRREGLPNVTPYAFKFSYHEKKTFSDKYDVQRRPKLKMSDEVRATFAEPPPDVSNMVTAPDLELLKDHREALGRFALIDMPIDQFYEPALAKLGESFDDEGGDDDESPEEGRIANAGDPDDELPASWGGGAEGSDSEEDASEDEDEDEDEDDGMVECDSCGKPMPETDMTCPHCCAEYEEVNGEIVLKPKPKRRRRSAK